LRAPRRSLRARLRSLRAARRSSRAPPTAPGAAAASYRRMLGVFARGGTAGRAHGCEPVRRAGHGAGAGLPIPRAAGRYLAPVRGRYSRATPAGGPATPIPAADPAPPGRAPAPAAQGNVPARARRSGYRRTPDAPATSPNPLSRRTSRRYPALKPPAC
jgi:hypothetical protein